MPKMWHLKALSCLAAFLINYKTLVKYDICIIRFRALMTSELHRKSSSFLIAILSKGRYPVKKCHPKSEQQKLLVEATTRKGCPVEIARCQLGSLFSAAVPQSNRTAQRNFWLQTTTVERAETQHTLVIFKPIPQLCWISNQRLSI